MKKIFLSGINGIGMSGLALILKDLGYEVTGSDINFKAITEVLENKGIKVFLKQEKENAQSDNFDTYVYSSAIKQDNPEYMYFSQKKVDMLKRGELLAKIMDRLEKSIAVAGTHGKTTTSSMLSVAFLSKDPYIAVGGIIPEINSNSRVGMSNYFIAEADESDNSFLYMHPNYSIITNIEADHLEFHGNLDNIKQSFSQFISQTKKNVLACYDCDILKEYKDDKIIYYSINEENKEKVSIYAKDIKFSFGKSIFNVIKNGIDLGTFTLTIPGLHNISNALPVIYLATEENVNLDILKEALKNFKGANRRYQIIYDEKFRIIDDYAHHPTEILATINAAKMNEGREIIVIFEPHRYSRTALLLNDFINSLKNADKLFLLDIYSAGEENTYNISSNEIAKSIKNAKVISKDNIYEILLNEVCDNKTYIFMGAGQISSIAHEFVRRLKCKY